MTKEVTMTKVGHGFRYQSLQSAVEAATQIAKSDGIPYAVWVDSDAYVILAFAATLPGGTKLREVTEDGDVEVVDSK